MKVQLEKDHKVYTIAFDENGELDTVALRQQADAIKKGGE